ncbi:MAG: (Fe-S)-binding protein [Chthonomonadales bacterium]
MEGNGAPPYPEEPYTLKCVRCGFCLDACPTFRVTGNEAESPRGRIALVRGVGEGHLALDGEVLRHMDACLGCRACETACPSGVPFGSILESFRARTEQADARPAFQRAARRMLLGILTRPRLLRSALAARHAVERLGWRADRFPEWVGDLLGAGGGQTIELPAAVDTVPEKMPPFNPADAPRRFTVAVLPGCVMPVLYPGINTATVRVLQWAGCDVLVPQAAGCCGALHLHAGYREEAKALARRLIDALQPAQFDALVINSAGCGSTVKEYGELLADDARYSADARSLAAKTKDVMEFLDEIGIPEIPGRYERLVAYHEACHLVHAQRVSAAPRRILEKIPGLRLVELAEADQCCGSAGIYSFLQPGFAAELLRRKVCAVAAAGADVLAAGNPGCLAWIARGLKDHNIRMELRHPVEILAAALDPPAVRPT